MRSLCILPSCILAGVALTACGGTGGAPSGDAVTGAVQLAAIGSAHDVIDVHFEIVDGPDCATSPLAASKTVSIESETLDPALGQGDGHRFSDALFVLPPGGYFACATPLRLGGAPSAICLPAERAVNVMAQQTQEYVLVSQCDDGDSGAVDVVTALNDGPDIDDVAVTPSKLIEICDSATITLTATDPEGDPLTYDWQVTMKPGGSLPALSGGGATATFSSNMVGDYEITVTVTDVHLASATLSFPMHVEAGTCSPPGSVEWLQAAGGTSQDRATAVAALPGGGAVVAGGYRTCELRLRRRAAAGRER